MTLLESDNLVKSVDPAHLDWALLQFFNSYKENSLELVAQRRKRLDECLPGLFGYALKTYYLANESLPFPGSPDSLFPESYLSLHDAHHVLLGADTTREGEVYVTAFESGMMTGHDARLLTVFGQIQVLLEHHSIYLFDAATAAKAFTIGSQVSRELLDSFDPWQSLDIPLASLRANFGIIPLSDIWG